MNSAIFQTVQLKKAISTFFSLKYSSSILPILEYMKIVCFPDGYASVRATDLVIDCKHDVECQTQSTESFIFIAPIKKVYQALKYIETAEVTFEIYENDVVIISDDIRISIRVHFPADNYIKCVVPDDSSKGYIIVSSEFIHMFKTAAKFACKDELRPSMCGVNLTKCDINYDNGETRLYYVATDAHLLIFKRAQQIYLGYDMIIPADSASVIAACFKQIEPLLIFKRDNKVVIHGERCKISIRLIDEKYPNWETVLPKDDAFSLYLKRKQLIPKLHLNQAFTNKTTKQVIFTIGKEKMKIYGEDVEWQDSVNTSVPVFNSNQEADEYKVGFNTEFFLKAISTQPDDLIRITHSQNTVMPSVINGEVLIMPIQLGNYDL